MNAQKLFAAAAVLALISSTARAEEAAAPADQSDPSNADPQEQIVIDDGSGSAAGELEPGSQDRVTELEDRIAHLEQALEQAKRPAPPPLFTVSLGGYADFGGFWPFGDGTGVIEDYNHRILPRFKDQYAWVFLGDLLSTTVNSRGEAADLGQLPGVQRFDSIHSRGAPGFVLNTLNLEVKSALGSFALFTGSVSLVPRTGKDFAIGDFIDVDLAQLELVLSETVPTSIFVGKIDPVFGIEYKERRAPARFGITPTLIGRYTINSQLGVKARTKLFDQWLILAAAVTNGSASQEQFHFYDELDSNYGKTLSGRAAIAIPFHRLFPEVFGGDLELGFSGEWGAQDHAQDSDGAMVLFGPDLEYRGTTIMVKAQLITGSAPGRPDQGVFSLDLGLSGYVELDYLATSWLGLMVRGELRRADVALPPERIYITRQARATGGVQLSFSEHALLKVEYLHNIEYGDVPELDNDVLTSSLLLMF